MPAAVSALGGAGGQHHPGPHLDDLVAALEPRADHAAAPSSGASKRACSKLAPASWAAAQQRIQLAARQHGQRPGTSMRPPAADAADVAHRLRPASPRPARPGAARPCARRECRRRRSCRGRRVLVHQPHRSPARASTRAQALPAGPAPMMSTSQPARRQPSALGVQGHGSREIRGGRRFRGADRGSRGSGSPCLNRGLPFVWSCHNAHAFSHPSGGR
jgi:hypothetical protein